TIRSLPDRRIMPLSGSTKPQTALTRVDLPDPDSPAIPKLSPICTSKLTSSIACVRNAAAGHRDVLNVLLTFWTVSITSFMKPRLWSHRPCPDVRASGYTEPGGPRQHLPARLSLLGIGYWPTNNDQQTGNRE